MFNFALVALDFKILQEFLDVLGFFKGFDLWEQVFVHLS